MTGGDMHTTFKQALMEIAHLDEEKIAECGRLAQVNGKPLARVLLEQGHITEDVLLKICAERMSIPYLPEITSEDVPRDFVLKIPYRFAKEKGVVAIGTMNGKVKVATCAPWDVYALHNVRAEIGVDIILAVSTRQQIEELINKAFHEKSGAVDQALEEIHEEKPASEVDLSEVDGLAQLENQAPVVKFVNSIIFEAVKMRASDIHVQPFKERILVRFRIDGILYDYVEPPRHAQEAIISRIKVMGGMDIAERLKPQDGRTTVFVAGREIDIRMSVVPSLHGERAVLRLLDKSTRLYDLSEIGLDDRDYSTMCDLIRAQHGIILLTGPTGSGKTTTLYAILNRINTKEQNIMTIEDPIEYHLEGISQMQTSVKKGVTFANGLRSIVRQDPDVIMVGEIRDHETAEIAIQSSLTGHLVLSTLHTNDAPSAITRLLNIGIEPYLVSSSVNAAIAQRLIRLICPHCREEYTPEALHLRRAGLEHEAAQGQKFYRGAGCEKCLNRGYIGRTGIYEILVLTERIREMIMNREKASTIKQEAFQNGFRTLRMDGVSKVLKGETTVEEVLRVTQMDMF
jgi:general secretion pathway protein E